MYTGCDVPGCANYLRRLGIEGDPQYRWDRAWLPVRRLARCGHPELAGEVRDADARRRIAEHMDAVELD